MAIQPPDQGKNEKRDADCFTATGGDDKSMGANFMCVNNPKRCWFVDYCYKCCDGTKHKVKRKKSLSSISTLRVPSCTLYFYEDILKGWCNKKDYNYGCKK